MELTKEKAQGMWCPMVRVETRPMEAATDNRMANWADPSCIADRCMMWEWVDEEGGFGYCGMSRLR